MTKANTSLRPLLAMAELLGADAKLKKELQFATDSPDQFCTERAALLARSRIFGPVTDLPWLALLEGLKAKKKMQEFDWREAPSEMLLGLKALKPKLDWSWAAEDIDALGSAEFVERVVRGLAKSNWALLSLSVGGDFYSFVLVSRAQQAQLFELGALAGYQIVPANRAISTRAKRKLYRPLVARRQIAATPSMWRKIEKEGLGPCALSELNQRWAYEGSLAKQRERVLSWAKLKVWSPELSRPESILSPAPGNAAVLTNHRLYLVMATPRAHERIAVCDLEKIRRITAHSPGSGTLNLFALELSPKRKTVEHELWCVSHVAFVEKIQAAVLARRSRARSAL